MLNLNKCAKSKPRPKPTLSVRTALMCVHINMHNCRDIFPLILQTISIAHMMSIGGKGGGLLSE